MAGLPDAGGFAGLGAGVMCLWLVLKYKPWKQEKHHEENGHSGEKPASYWELKIGEIVHKKLIEHEACVRQIIREELDRK